MGRTPHRGRPSQRSFSGRPVTAVLRLILKCLSLLTNTQRSKCIIKNIWIFGMFEIDFVFPLNCFNHVSCLHSHSNYRLCMSSSQILTSISIIFWFQIRKRRRRDEAASQQALPSTSLMVGNSDLFTASSSLFSHFCVNSCINCYQNLFCLFSSVASGLGEQKHSEVTC